MKEKLIIKEKIIRKLFMEYISKGNNGVFGPGFYNYSYYKLSYGKIAIWILVLFITLKFTLE